MHLKLKDTTIFPIIHLIFQRINKLAAQLRALGIEPEDTI